MNQRKPALVLAGLTFLAFLPALRNGFVSWDDGGNLVQNPWFQGLALENLIWAWQARLSAVYQPLAWWLFSLEHAVFGLEPWGYHLVSVVLHAANAAVLFTLVLRVAALAYPERFAARRGSFVAGAFAAAGLFAIHPLRVETVAWASCQPYLPCILLCQLSVLAYLRAAAEGGGFRRPALWLSLGLFTGALLFKAPAMGLPAFLLALDFFPLRRRAWGEKLPFLVLSAVFGGIAYSIRESAGVFVPIEGDGFLLRLLQACHLVWFYLLKTALPWNLSPLYLWADMTLPEFVLHVAAAVATAGVTVALVLKRRAWPGLLGAWLAYLAVLAPNAGLLRTGPIIAADRYTYLSMLPLVVWAGVRAGASVRSWRALAGGGAALGAVLVALSGLQLGVWHDARSFWIYTDARVGDRSEVALNEMGRIFLENGWVDEAVSRLERSVAMDTSFWEPRFHLGRALLVQKRYPEAAAELRRARELAPPDDRPKIESFLRVAEKVGP